jgi:hypothetical protein
VLISGGRRDLRRPLRFGECNSYALHFNLAELRHMDVPHAEAACG